MTKVQLSWASAFVQLYRKKNVFCFFELNSSQTKQKPCLLLNLQTSLTHNLAKQLEAIILHMQGGDSHLPLASCWKSERVFQGQQMLSHILVVDMSCLLPSSYMEIWWEKFCSCPSQPRAGCHFSLKIIWGF